MVIMSGRCLLLSIAKSGLLESTHGAWLLLRPFLSLKSFLHLDVCLCTCAGALAKACILYCVWILLPKMEIFTLFFSVHGNNLMINRHHETADRTDTVEFRFTVMSFHLCSTVIHTGVVRVIDVLKNRLQDTKVFGWLGICHDVLIRIPHSSSQLYKMGLFSPTSQLCFITFY